MTIVFNGSSLSSNQRHQLVFCVGEDQTANILFNDTRFY